MQPTDFSQLIAAQLGIARNQVTATVKLIEEGCTTPFIARYRKEQTFALDEVKIEEIRLLNQKYEELSKRKVLVLDTIREAGKLTPELEKTILNCWESNLLEDIYLPFKPKRKTKATAAKEKGLEPLALWILQESNQNPDLEARRFLNSEVKDIDEALEGARDIIAEVVSEDSRARGVVRHQFERFAVVRTKAARNKEAEAVKYKDYFEFDEMLHRCPSHRMLAIFRGEDEGLLRVNIGPDEEPALEKLSYLFIKRNNACSEQIELAMVDSYKRLLQPSMENEFRSLAKAKADEEAIKVFTENLRQLLLAAPLGNKRILAVDPGFRSGCKVVCLNEEGKLIADDIIYPHEPQNEYRKAEDKIYSLVEKYKIQAIAIGNGTAGRETEDLVRSMTFKENTDIFMVNENGASVYSASPIAREEFPDKDITVRGAVSIGRRLSDPLAELVKIDAKSIGVGQYQHDVDQNKLKQSLDTVVMSCVNLVGVNVNYASKSLLTYVSGLTEQTAQNIIDYRNENGPFHSRNELKKVPRLGSKAFEQCAAFIRIPGAKNVLDNSAVHPESYGIVEEMAKKQKCKVQDLIQQETIRKAIRAEDFITQEAGLPTITDILKELARPGRDPRDTIKSFSFANIKKPEDLTLGMVVPGIVTNITRFGCFVDIGVKQDGMVHISQMADKFISDPHEIVKLQQQVQVKVTEVDMERKRIGLSMKGV
jgi:protein Tex